MENIRLQQRVEDLENSLKNIKISVYGIKKMDVSSISKLSFEEGFNHAMAMVNSSISVLIDPYLDKK